ncbi:hypothetical protein CFN78_21585 [Amycolatopsis antarctica]|uniref:J domain-containing protein n=1 Tax=Amycolatopsis antarctica TaxID=1854586 RepID=A0A263CYN1_9PSEU|nr:hypothetical protein [Amycolatopsis antarctica]OZM71069.1 hypothetical protein CFN78_21585 [Amycolatopsis antarctica]
MTHGPHEDTDARESRAAFRAFVRANHPDVGGDPEEFAAGLRRLRAQRDGERETGTTSGPASPGSPATEPENLSRYDAPIHIVVDRGGVAGTVDRVRRWRGRRKRPPRVI